MARKPRIEFDGAYYQVIVRVNQRGHRGLAHAREWIESFLLTYRYGFLWLVHEEKIDSEA